MRFIASSLGAGILYFLLQVGWLSWYAYDQCRAADDPGVQDCIWYVYKQVPSALPLAAVFAAGIIVFAQILDRFVESAPPSAKWGIRDWLRAILLMCSIALVVLGFTVFSDKIPTPLTWFFVGILYVQVTQPWVAWITCMVGAERNSTGQ